MEKKDVFEVFLDGQVVLRDNPEDVEPTDKNGRSDARNKAKLRKQPKLKEQKTSTEKTTTQFHP